MTDLVFTFRHVGKTELRIPAFGLVKAHIGERYAPVPQANSRGTLEAAWDRGVPFYDTALWSGPWLIEPAAPLPAGH